MPVTHHRSISGLLAAGLVLASGCASAPVLSNPTDACLDARVWVRDAGAVRPAPGIAAAYRKETGLAVVKVKVGPGGFPGVRESDLERRLLEPVPGEPGLRYAWGVVDACGRFVLPPTLSYVDVRSDGAGLAHVFFAPDGDRPRFEAYRLDLTRGRVERLKLPGVTDLRMVGLSTVALRRPWAMKPSETELVIARLETPERPLLAAAMAEIVAVEGDREVPVPKVALAVAVPWAEAMARFGAAATPAFYYSRVPAEDRKYATDPDRTRWVDADGNRLSLGGRIVGRFLGRFVVERGEGYAVVDADGTVVLGGLEARPWLDRDQGLVVVDPGEYSSKGYRFRFFDLQLKPIEGERGEALFAAWAERLDRLGAELEAKLEADRVRGAEKARQRREDERRHAAADAAEREAALRAEREATVRREEAERREDEARRRVRFVIGDRVQDEVPAGWPEALREPAASVEGHYESGPLSCDVKRLARDRHGVPVPNEIGVWCMSSSTGRDNPLRLETTTIVEYGEKPTAVSIRTVKWGASEYELGLTAHTIRIVWSERRGFELLAHGRRLVRTRGELVWPGNFPRE